MPSSRKHIAWATWPLTALFLSELARLWPALHGARSFAAASPARWLSLFAWTVVAFVSIGAYAGSWTGFDRSSDAGPYRSPGCARLQKLAGGLAWGLVGTHLALRWWMMVRAGPVALSHYELLREILSRPPVLAFYVLGVAAFGLFLSQGIAASFRAWGFARRPETSRWLEVGCTLASAVMMLMAVNVLSHFATGRAFWMESRPPVSPQSANAGDRTR